MFGEEWIFLNYLLKLLIRCSVISDFYKHQMADPILIAAPGFHQDAIHFQPTAASVLFIAIKPSPLSIPQKGLIRGPNLPINCSLMELA